MRKAITSICLLLGSFFLYFFTCRSTRNRKTTIESLSWSDQSTLRGEQLLNSRTMNSIKGVNVSQPWPGDCCLSSIKKVFAPRCNQESFHDSIKLYQRKQAPLCRVVTCWRRTPSPSTYRDWLSRRRYRSWNFPAEASSRLPFFSLALALQNLRIQSLQWNFKFSRHSNSSGGALPLRK